MNQAETVTELRRRGYSPAQAELAVVRALRDGEYPLGRHRVLLSGDGRDEFAIIPLPWPEGAARVSPPVPASPGIPAHVHDDDGTVEGCPGCFADPDLAWMLKVIVTVDAWLDSAASPEYQAQPLAQDWARITKACEEAGEAWKAHSRLTGENPRHRGSPDTRAHMLEELGDTASAALCGIQHVTKDIRLTWVIFTEALAKAYSRVPDEARPS